MPAYTESDLPFAFDQYNDGPNVWLYDESFTEELRVGNIPSPGRHGAAESQDEQEAAASGKAICILTDDDFGGCRIHPRQSTLDGCDNEYRAEAICGWLHLPSGTMRIEGPNWLRIDQSLPDFQDEDCESVRLSLPPGEYQVCVHRLRSDVEENDDVDVDEILITLDRLQAGAAKPPNTFFLGFEVVNLPVESAVITGSAFAGNMEVDECDYFIRMSKKQRESLALAEGNVLCLEGGSNQLTLIYTTRDQIDPVLRSDELVEVLDQLDGFAVRSIGGIRCQLFNSTAFDEGTHSITVRPTTLRLNGSDVESIPLTTPAEQMTDALQISAADPGPVCQQLSAAVRDCNTWSIRVGVVRNNNEYVLEVSASVPNQIHARFSSADYKSTKTWNSTDWPEGTIDAMVWGARQADGGCFRPQRVQYSAELRTPGQFSEDDVAELSRRGWNEMTGH